MKLLKTLQTLVDKTKELDETVATQTSEIERLATQVYLANKDNASNNDTKQKYQERRDKFINNLYGVSIINNAINNKYIYLDVSDIYAFNRISIRIVRPEKEDCYKVEEYGYFINLDNATTEIPETLDKIVEKVASIVNLATGNDNDNNRSCQPIVDRMIKDILSVKGNRVSPLLAFLVHYNYIENYRCNFHWQSDIERYKLEFTFDYNGEEYKLSDNETIYFAKRLLIKLYTNQSDTVRDQLITNFVEGYNEHHIATNSDTECDTTGNATTWLANKRKFNNPADNDMVDIKQKSDTSNLANDITTKLSTINPDLRPATNLSEFLLHYGYIHGYTRSNYYNEITYEFDYKGKRYTLHQYDTLTQVKHIITDIVNKDLEHLLDNYTEWTIAIANNNNKQ